MHLGYLQREPHTGANILNIKRYGGWKSDTAVEYIDTFMENKKRIALIILDCLYSQPVG